MRYVKKPIQIDAIQYRGENSEEILDFIEATRATIKNTYMTIVMPTYEFIVKVGDFVVKDAANVIYISPENIFNATYELLQDNFGEEDL